MLGTSANSPIAIIGDDARKFYATQFHLEVMHTPQGAALPLDSSAVNTAQGAIPYWRVAYQKQMSNDYLMLGTFGLHAELYPAGVTGPTNQYNDLGFDAQYEHPTGAGAIIGHNSGGGNTLGGALIGGAAGALAGGTIGNSVDHENGTVYNESVPERRVIRTVQQVPPPPPPMPPAPAETVTPSPAANAVWIPGYWSFNGSAYAWVGGHWEIPPANTIASASLIWPASAAKSVRA